MFLLDEEQMVLLLQTVHVYLHSSEKKCGPDSSVCIATGYGLDGPGFESRWG